MGLLTSGDRLVCVQLDGGISSDIWRVEIGARKYCLKRALAKLKVAADWRAPVERNHAEAEWLRVAAALAPRSVPRILGEDARRARLRWNIWNPQPTRSGKTRCATATSTPQPPPRWRAPSPPSTPGRRSARTSRNALPTIIFFTRSGWSLICSPPPRAIRTAPRGCAELVETTAHTKLALVHGDLSPKNILVAAHGPILLDAECAWYGDPAFDLAFCLNHMLLKCLWRPQWRERYLACYDALASTYLAAVTWEPRAALEARVAHLLPGLFLGRVDGKSPAEYLTQESDKDQVRRVARSYLLRPADRLASMRDAWNAELKGA